MNLVKKVVSSMRAEKSPETKAKSRMRPKLFIGKGEHMDKKSQGGRRHNGWKDEWKSRSGIVQKKKKVRSPRPQTGSCRQREGCHLVNHTCFLHWLGKKKKQTNPETGEGLQKKNLRRCAYDFKKVRDISLRDDKGE